MKRHNFEGLITGLKKVFQNKLHSSADQNTSVWIWSLFKAAKPRKKLNSFQCMLEGDISSCVCAWGGGGVLSVTGCIFLFTGRRAYKWGWWWGGGVIIGSLRYLFFGISFYRMRFRHICSFSLRPLLAVGVKVWKRSTWRIISHLVHTGCPKCTFPIQCSWSPCDFNGSFGHSCPEYLDCIQCCDSCGNYECVPPGGPPSS